MIDIFIYFFLCDWRPVKSVSSMIFHTVSLHVMLHKKRCFFYSEFLYVEIHSFPPALQYKSLVLPVLSWNKLIVNGNSVDRDVAADILSLLQIDKPRIFFFLQECWLDWFRHFTEINTFLMPGWTFCQTGNRVEIKLRERLMRFLFFSKYLLPLVLHFHSI